jgi:hypothetical protein
MLPNITSVLRGIATLRFMFPVYGSDGFASANSVTIDSLS